MRAVATLLALAALGCATSSAGGDAASQLVALLEGGGCGAAAALFHYPEDLRGEALERDRQGVAAQLDTLCALWGLPEEIAPADLPRDLGEIGVFGGTLAYWTAKPRDGIDAERSYRVRFGRAGPGFLHVALHDTGGIRRVRSAGFAIDLRRDGARALLEQTLARMREELDR